MRSGLRHVTLRDGAAGSLGHDQSLRPHLKTRENVKPTHRGKPLDRLGVLMRYIGLDDQQSTTAITRHLDGIHEQQAAIDFIGQFDAMALMDTQLYAVLLAECVLDNMRDVAAAGLIVTNCHAD